MALPIRIHASSGRRIPLWLKVNINYVYGFNDSQPQSWMAPGLWFSLLMGFNLVCLYVPTHAGLRKLFAEPARASVTMLEEVVSNGANGHLR